MSNCEIIDFNVEAFRLLYLEELAAALGKGRVFVHAMQRAGFPAPGGQANLMEARSWLSAFETANGRSFRVSDAY